MGKLSYYATSFLTTVLKPLFLLSMVGCGIGAAIILGAGLGPATLGIPLAVAAGVSLLGYLGMKTAQSEAEIDYTAERVAEENIEAQERARERERSKNHARAIEQEREAGSSGLGR